MPWDDISQAAMAITAAATAGVTLLGLAQRLATVSGRIGHNIGRTWQRWQRERRAQRRRRRRP